MTRLPKPHRFVVYHIESTMQAKTFVYRHHAEKHCNRLNVSYPLKYAFTTIADYNDKVVHMVERVNLMSGKKFMEPSNTPNYCSPASEAYWSM